MVCTCTFWSQDDECEAGRGLLCYQSYRDHQDRVPLLSEACSLWDINKTKQYTVEVNRPERKNLIT